MQGVNSLLQQDGDTFDGDLPQNLQQHGKNVFKSVVRTEALFEIQRLVNRVYHFSKDDRAMGQVRPPIPC